MSADDLFSITEIKDLEIGKTYPIYGMITKIISDTVNNVVVEVNSSIKLTMVVKEEEKIKIIRDRSFEPGIFVTTVEKKSLLVEESIYAIEGLCTTVIFGRRNTKYDA